MTRPGATPSPARRDPDARPGDGDVSSGSGRRGVSALVVCGGRSARMGEFGDKARLDVGGRSLLDCALEAAAAVAERRVLATGATLRYAELGLPTVLDDVADAGPLAGLVAGLEEAAAAGARWVVALACDLPGVDASILEELLERARKRDLDACLLQTRGGLEPLVAVYHVRCATSARAALEAGQRRLVSFHAGLDVEGLAPGPDRSAAFEDAARNLNTPEELDRERARRSTSAETSR